MTKSTPTTQQLIEQALELARRVAAYQKSVPAPHGTAQPGPAPSSPGVTLQGERYGHP